MSKFSKWREENVEVAYPFEKKRLSDEYYPLGGPIEKPIKIGIGRMHTRGILVPSKRQPRCPNEQPDRFGFVKFVAIRLAGLVLFIVLSVIIGRFFR